MSRRPRFSKFNLFSFKRLKQIIIRPLTAAVSFGVIGSTLIYFSLAAPYIAPNPTIMSQSCLGGLNIALLADASGSIEPQEFVKMQAALKDFVSSLLPSTRTSFSLTDFAGTASVIQPFTNNASDLINAIDGLEGSRSGTNWTAGLDAAYSTFAGAPPDAPGLLLIATDGNPTQPGNDPLTSAIDKANFIKSVNVHILVLGIGGDLTVQNLHAISGPKLNTGGVNADVITTDFSTMQAALQEIARSSCTSGGGTGGFGTGSGGFGDGTGGTGTGAGGFGSGTGGFGDGTGGTGTGVGGFGSGSQGFGNGTAGTGTGTSTGANPQPSPTPVPTAKLGVIPSPTPTETPSPQPTPSPAATVSPDPTPTPAPTPMAQGIRTKPPEPQPSPFFDGKEFAPGSTPDSLASATTPSKDYTWLFATIAAVAIASAGGYAAWRRKYKPAAKTAKKPSKK